MRGGSECGAATVAVAKALTLSGFITGNFKHKTQEQLHNCSPR